jgi:regulator of sigma E protease
MLLAIIYFLLILTGIVVVHELGHYIFSRLFGVRVLEFAIGMGPKLWSKKGKKTTFRINAFPIGGYVRPAGEDLDSIDSSIPDSEQIQNKPAWQRFIIYFAGPAFSLLLGFLILSLVAVIWGFQEVKIDKVEPGSPAAVSGMMPGDRIVSVNGKTLIDNTRLSEAVAKGERIDLVVNREGKEIEIAIIPELLPQEAFFVIGGVSGEPGEVLSSINGGTFNGDYVGYGSVLSPESSIKLGFEDGSTLSGTLLTYSPAEERYAMGIYYANFKPQLAIDHGQFREGDTLLSVNGMKTETSYDLTTMSQLLSLKPDELLIQFTGKEISFAEFGFPDEFVVSVEREGQLINMTVSKNEMIALVEEAGAFAQGSSYWYPDTALEAAGLGIQWANNLLITLVKVVGSLFTGGANINEFTGPIGLVTIVDQAVSLGLRIVLYLAGFISLNLGVINLIPFPALDGGRMLLALIEMITRRRLDPKIEGLINVIGFMVLMGFMIYITFIDIGRWL